MIASNAEKIRQQRAASFGGVAGDYALSRPGYPDAAVRWLTEGRPDVVLDVAAGTGKLTLQLRDYNTHSLTALELSVPMLLELQTLDQTVAAVSGRAEALPFRSGSFDLITVAQAFHWFDQQSAAAEFARVLRPGGRVGILWNFRDESVDWVAQLSKLIGSEDSEDEDFFDRLSSLDHFGPSAKRIFEFEQVLDRDLLVALVRSRSYVATLPDEDRASLLVKVARLCDEHPSLAGCSQFSMPYRTHVYRAERIG